MNRRKQVAGILILSVSIICSTAFLIRTGENQKIIDIMNRYDEIDTIRITSGQRTAVEIENPDQVQAIKEICRLRSLYAVKEVEKEHSAALVEMQLYAQGALVGTAQLYQVVDGDFLELEKQKIYQTKNGTYFILEWEKSWAFPIREKEAQIILDLLKKPPTGE